MSNPLIEQIILQVIDSLGDITTANGYNQTVGTIHRPTSLQARNQATYRSFDMAVTLGESAGNEEYDYAGNPPVIGLTQEIMLDMIYRPAKDSTEAIDAVLARFEGDVRRTLMQDPQINSLACDSDMDEPDFWGNADDGTVGATVVLNVHYRIAENDPYQVPSSAPSYPYIFDGGAADTANYDDIIGT